LRFLKCGLADMQGRLDALLSEIGAELQQPQGEREPAAGLLADVPHAQETEAVAAIAIEPAIAETLAAPDAEIALEVIEVPAASEAVEIDAIVVAEPTVEVVEPAQAEAAVEPVQAEIAEVAVAAEPTAQTQSVVDAIPTVDSSEPVVPVEVWSEAVVPAAAQVDAAAAQLPGRNVVVLAEHREKIGKRRGVIARTARWAAAIALIATVAAVAAAGTGFAGNGELLIKSVCAIAGDGCSVTLGMP